jgi:hypothetical protein
MYIKPIFESMVIPLENALAPKTIELEGLSPQLCLPIHRFHTDCFESSSARHLGNSFAAKMGSIHLLSLPAFFFLPSMSIR